MKLFGFLSKFLRKKPQQKQQVPAGTTEDLVKWLQDYANEHRCYVAMDEPIYSPKFHTFTESPMLYHEDDEGYWYWSGKNRHWIDDKIPENLRRAPDPDFRVIYRPENPLPVEKNPSIWIKGMQDALNGTFDAKAYSAMPGHDRWKYREGYCEQAEDMGVEDALNHRPCKRGYFHFDKAKECYYNAYRAGEIIRKKEA